MMGKKVSHFYSRLVSIDLGSTNTTIYHIRRKKIFREPSLLALDKARKTVVVTGKGAKEMVGRVPSRYKILAPIRNGVISNFDGACMMLKSFLWRFFPIKRWPLIAAVNIPHGASQVEKQAVIDAVRSAGARELHLVETPLAAMMGVDLPYDPLKGSMIVDIGGGTTEIAVTALGGIVLGSSLSHGGEELDQSLSLFFRKKYHLNIGINVAESLKIKGAYLLEPPDEVVKVAGVFLDSRLPGYQDINLKELKEVWQSFYSSLAREIRKVYDQTPPELASDIIKQGIFLTGGGAQVNELDQYLSQETALLVTKPQNPADCTVKGIAKVLGADDKSKKEG